MFDETSFLEKNLDRQIGFVRASESRVGVIVALLLFQSTIWITFYSIHDSEKLLEVLFLFIAGAIPIFSAVELFRALLPRVKGDMDSKIFFVAIAAIKRESYIFNTRKMNDEEYRRDLATQCWINASIATSKYKHMTRSLTLSMLGLLLLVFLLAGYSGRFYES